MSSGLKMFLWFAAGAAAGAAGISYLNRNRMDFSYLKPKCTELLVKGINIKDSVASRIAEIKEDFDDMAAEARDKVDAAKAACHEDAQKSSPQSNA